VSERFVFIGQDGYDALSLYIRRRGLPLDDEEFVFVTEKPFGKPIGDNSISQAFNVIVQRLKLSEPRGQLTKDGRKNKPKDLRLYTLRKAFSKFMAVNIDRTLVEYWLGHTSTATHYVSEDIEFHRAQYAKGYPSIQLELSQVPANITEELKKKDQEISKLKEDMEKLKPLMNFINAFDEPEELEHFLNLWKSADAIRFPPDKGEFSIVDLPEEIQETVDRVAKETGRKKNDIINELINLGSKASRQPDENPNKK
jgi:hypothetical protein